MNSNPSLAANPRVEDWITVRSDGLVEVRTGKVEIGQRITTAVALVVAGELGVPFGRIVMVPPRTGVSPDEGYTSGSNSMEQSGRAVRLAAATARRELIARAAKRLGVDAETLEVQDGLVRSRETNRTVRFGDLVEDAPLALPVDEEAPPLPNARGVPARAPSIEPLHLREIVTGTLRFVHDARPSDVLHTRIVRPPHYHAPWRRLATASRPISKAPGSCETAAFSRWRPRTNTWRFGPPRGCPPRRGGTRRAHWTSGRCPSSSSATGGRAFRCSSAGRARSRSPSRRRTGRERCARSTSAPTRCTARSRRRPRSPASRTAS